MRKLIIPLKENHLFSRAYARGKCEVTKYIAVYLLKNYKKEADGSVPKSKLGITVNRKLAKACKRNRIKRLIREAYRKNHSLVRDGYIFVIAARGASLAPYVKEKHISEALSSVLSKPGFYDIKNTKPQNAVKTSKPENKS